MRSRSFLAVPLPGIVLYGLAYVLWLLNLAACTVALLQLRSSVNALWVAAGGDKYALGLVNQVCLLSGGLAAFTYVVALESYYRHSIMPWQPPAGGPSSQHPPRRSAGSAVRWATHTGLDVLLRRFAATLAVPAGVLAVSLFMLEVALRVVG